MQQYSDKTNTGELITNHDNNMENNNKDIKKTSNNVNNNMNMNMNGVFYFKVYAELRYINAKPLPYVKRLYSAAP